MSNCITATPPAVERARKALKEGEGLLIGRQKAIRIVDGSEYCWVMAQENKDKLAANSDDKKRLYRVEMRAGGKLKAAAAKGQEIELLRKNWQSRAQLKPSPAAGDSTSFSSASNQQSSSSSVRCIPTVQGLGCFLCKRMGHFRKSCPLLQSNQSSSMKEVT